VISNCEVAATKPALPILCPADWLAGRNGNEDGNCRGVTYRVDEP